MSTHLKRKASRKKDEIWRHRSRSRRGAHRRARHVMIKAIHALHVAIRKNEKKSSVGNPLEIYLMAVGCRILSLCRVLGLTAPPT
jgi:hypothetical protein